MNKQTLQKALRTVLVMGDILSFAGALSLAFYLRFYMQLIPLKYGVPPFSIYLYAMPVVVIVMLLAFNYAGLYMLQNRRSRFDELFGIILSITAGIVILMSATFIFREVSYSRIVILYTWGLSVFMVFVWRMVYRKIHKFFRKRERLVQKIVIAGATEISKILIERINRHPEMGYKIIGCVDNKKKKRTKFNGIPVIGRIKDITAIINRENIDEVFIGLSDYKRKEIADVILANERTKFMIASDILGIITKNIEYDEIHGIPVFTVRDLPLNNMGNRAAKRTLDFVFSLLGIIVISPVLIVVAALVKLSSKGPVLYKQDRVGRDNKEFFMYKFRSMRIDSEDKSGPVWAKKGDERTTKIGKFLRKTSIDELPQLFNILKGEMSLVGPRPERPHFVRKFKDEIPRYLERHKVKAGLTGWAQVNGLRGDTSLEERIKYDLYYIENWSLWFDIKILIKTALEIFHHDAY